MPVKLMAVEAGFLFENLFEIAIPWGLFLFLEASELLIIIGTYDAFTMILLYSFEECNNLIWGRHLFFGFK